MKTGEASPSQRSLKSILGRSVSELTDKTSPEKSINSEANEKERLEEEGELTGTIVEQSRDEDVIQEDEAYAAPEIFTARKQFLIEEQKKQNVVSKKDINNYIKEYVRSNIYPKMKFFRRSDAVSSRSKVAQMLLNEVSGIPRERIQERDDWWNKYVRIVRSTIDDRRSANSNAIKDNFMRK